jgi:DNA topoisomerase IB
MLKLSRRHSGSAAIEKVAGRLSNTPTICRKCYVHPEVLNSYMDGNLVLDSNRKPRANCAALSND